MRRPGQQESGRIIARRRAIMRVGPWPNAARPLGRRSAASSTTSATPASLASRAPARRASTDARSRCGSTILQSLARIAPGVDAARQHRRTTASACAGGPTRSPARATPPDVVVEAFGCGLPDAVDRAMAGTPRARRLDRRSNTCRRSRGSTARTRVRRRSRAPGSRAGSGVPGFTPATGGLLREPGLLAGRDAFLRDGGARDAATRWRARRPGTRVALVFCYPDARAAGVVRRVGRRRHAGDLALVPDGVAIDALDRWTGGAVPSAGETRRAGRLTLASIPFVAQDDFDRLLWSCDLRFRARRGLVRARAVGGAPVRMARLSAGRRARTGRSSTRSSTATSPRAARRRRWPCAGSGGAQPGRRCRRSPQRGPRSTRARPALASTAAPGRRRWPQLPELASRWSVRR